MKTYMSLGSVYKIIENETNKIIYVGQHWYNTEGTKSKYGEGPNDKYMGSGTELNKMYKTLGKDKFRKEIIAYDIQYQKDMDLIEKLFIEIYKPDMNKCNGGAFNVLGMRHTIETKEKMKESHKNRVVSEETLLKLKGGNSTSFKKGCVSPNKGKIPWNKGLKYKHKKHE